MSDDKLLEALGKAARDNARDDPYDEQWEALSRGELSEEQIETLAAMAAEGVVPPDAIDAFRPLGDEFRRGVAAQAAEALGAGEPAADSQGAAAPIPFPTRTPEPRRRMNLAPAALAASVMLAVGIGFFAMPRTGVEPIPGYSFQLQGGSTSRSGAPAGEVPVFRSGDRFELRLTPHTAVDGSVVARIYVESAAGLTPLATPAAVLAPSGAVRIVGTTGADVALPDGESALVVVVGRDGSLPDATDLRRSLSADTAAGKGWAAWRIGVRVEP